MREVWLSTDPLQEKYLGISTYAYTAQNPIKYIDPDGKQVGSPYWNPYGSTQQARADVLAQQYPPVQSTWKGALKAMGRDIKKVLDWIAPVSVGVTAEIAVGAGAESTQKISGSVITRGDDAGELTAVQTESRGVNTDIGVTGVLGIDISFADKPDKFVVEDVKGESTEATYTANLKAVDVSVSVTTAKTKKAGNVNTYSLTVGKGVNLSLKGLFKFSSATVQTNQSEIIATTKDNQ